MESFESKQYRDDLAKKLDETRKTDSKKANEILVLEKETDVYQEARKTKLKDFNFENNEKTIHAEIGSVRQEKREDVKNLIEKFESLYYASELVTVPSQFARTSENPEGRERPFFLRAHRAEMFKKLEGLSLKEKQKILEESHVRDNIAEQYLNQKEIKINFPTYGEISARMVDIVPPESLVSSENKNLPPIFLIPGISNDLECVNNMACEMAMQGRRVVVLAMPDSIKGHITQEFSDAVEQDKTFGPHSEFFGEAIKHIFKDKELFELWGFSTGGAISALLLKNYEFQKRVKNAVLICPAGFEKQSSLDLKIGLAQDFAIMKNSKSVYGLFGYGFEKTEQLKLHDQVMGSIINKITEANENWKDAHVLEGGNILIVNGEKDMVTKSINLSDKYKENEQMNVLNLPNAYHMTPQLEADTIIPKILKEQHKFSI